MPYPDTTGYCSACKRLRVLMDDGRCGECLIGDPEYPPVGAWAMGHIDANDDIAKSFKAAWEAFCRYGDSLRSARKAREEAAAEWAATGEAGVRARWHTN